MRFAYVLGWKREDGSRIPETAAGLEETQGAGGASTSRRTDRSGQLTGLSLTGNTLGSPRSSASGKWAARRARHGPASRRAAQRSPSVFTSGSIPAALRSHPRPDGIEQHKALVARYERAYGASSVLDRKARARTYKAILDSIEREKTRRVQQAQRSKVVAAEKKKADTKLRAKNRTAKEKRDAARAQAEEVRERRNRQGRARYYRYRIRLSKQRIATSQKDVMSAEVLESYRGTSAYESVVKASDRAKQLLAIFRRNLASYKARLAALQL